MNIEKAKNILEYELKDLKAEYKFDIEDAKKGIAIDEPHAYYLNNRIEAIETILNTLKRHDDELDLDYVDKNYISKDKIKDKIQKLEREFDFYAGREHAEWEDGEFDGDRCDEISTKIGVLKELLEEVK